MTGTTKHIAKHLREFYFGKNWTGSDFKTHIENVTWQQATTKVYNFNTIATLVFHMNYYVKAVLRVFDNQPLNAKDELSFDHPPIESQKDWDTFLKSIFEEAETLAKIIEQMPETKLWEDFWDKKYGNFYRNLQGIVEHNHYHLGQIVLIKKMLVATK